jgi:GAF domain-containing protein
MDDNNTRSRDALLAQRFVALVDTLVDDYDVVDLLDRLVHAIVELLPVQQAGLLLLDDSLEPQLLASTSESTRVLELFQLQSSEGGPCIECVQTGAPVTVDDLSSHQGWPRFSQVALGMGFEAVHALPLRLRGEIVGALNLFGKRARLSESDREVGQSLADMATIGILQQRSSRQATIEAEQLRQALASRVVIEQAKGVLAEFAHVDMETAFQALRSYSRSRNLKLGDVAHAIVERRLPPQNLLAPGSAFS